MSRGRKDVARAGAIPLRLPVPYENMSTPTTNGSTIYVCARPEDCSVGVNVSKVDTWVVFARGKIVKVAVDRSRNGNADEMRVYMNGKLSRVQRDSNDDGKIDVWEIYDEGKLQREGVDLDRDGRVDRWDRDEVMLREINEKERREDEAAEKKAAEEERRKKEEALDGGVTDARVSARRRQ